MNIPGLPTRAIPAGWMLIPSLPAALSALFRSRHRNLQHDMNYFPE
jgi:hypothetical protein